MYLLTHGNDLRMSLISLDPSRISMSDMYKLMIGGIVPRPIGFVSTVNRAGQGNLAPFSYFNAVSSDPPCVSVSITRKTDGSKKDTLINIEETGQLVVNIVSESMVEPMNQCSAEYPYGVDEMAKVGLTPVPSLKVKPARVGESLIQFECETYQIVEVGEAKLGASSLVIARVVQVHVNERVYSKGRILIDELKPLARLGGLSYGKVSGVFDLPRPGVS